MARRRVKLLHALVLMHALLIVTLMVSTVFLQYYYGKRTVQHDIDRNLQNLNTALNESLDQRMSALASLSSSLYSPAVFKLLTEPRLTEGVEYQENGNTAVMNTALSSILSNPDMYVNGVYVFTSSGNVFYDSYIGQLRADYDYRHQWWFRKIEQSKGQAVIFGVHRPWQLDRYNDPINVFSIGLEIHDLTDKSVAVVLIDFELYSIVQGIQNFHFDDGTQVVVADEQHRVLYGGDVLGSNDNVGERIPSTSIALIQHAAVSHKTVDVRGQTYYPSYVRSSQSGWTLFSFTPAFAIQKSIQPIVRWMTVIIAIIVFLSILYWTWLYYGIYRPLVELMRSMIKIKGGQLLPAFVSSIFAELNDLTDTFNYMVEGLKNLIQANRREEQQKLRAQFSALQSQINPHFIANTLGMIRGMLETGKQSEFVQVSHSLISICNYLARSKSPIVRMADEVQNIKHYMHIQTQRFGDQVVFSSEVDPMLLNNAFVKLTLQPLIENSIVHGFSGQRGKLSIKLIVKRHRSRMLVYIIDNGRGMTRDKLKAIQQSMVNSSDTSIDEHIGLRNVYDRLKHVYGQHGWLVMKSIASVGTRILIVVPNFQELPVFYGEV